jgi:hypothetical protein
MPYLGLDPSFPEVSLRDAEETIEHIAKFDADERVFVVWSHDVTIHKTSDFYPRRQTNGREKAGSRLDDGLSWQICRRLQMGETRKESKQWPMVKEESNDYLQSR